MRVFFEFLNYHLKYYNNYFLGLNMFLVPIKSGTSKFSPYLILIVFLVPTKKIYF